MSDKSAGAEGSQAPSWLEVSLADVDCLEFEDVLAGSTAADAGDLAELYRVAESEAAGVERVNDPARVRVWRFLRAITGLYFKPADGHEPFGPMVVMADGRRSAVIADFRDHGPVLRSLAKAATNVVLRARLNDLAWVLNRKQAGMGVEALRAYTEIARQIASSELLFKGVDAPFHHGIRDNLLRALTLARMLGWSKPEAEAARAQLAAVRRQAVATRTVGPVQLYCELDLQMRVSDPLEVAAEIEAVLTQSVASIDRQSAADLWRLASAAYRAGKRIADAERCQVAVAEAMVALADTAGSAMLTAHFIGDAIATLHGVPSARQRRTELRHRLIEVQATVGEEMGTFSQPVDVSQAVEAVQREFRGLGVYDSLFAFALLDRSPDPETLRGEAVEQVRKHPLLSLFGAAHLDDEGKVVHRTSSSGFSTSDDAAVTDWIARDEGLRRSLGAAGLINPARRMITENYYLAEDVFYALLRLSPFVPQDLVQTFAKGFSRFFQGDFTSALYILVPLLENSLRYMLRLKGHDVATFDNALRTQEDRSITSLYNGLRPELDAIFTRAITDDIERVFLARPGPAIRHGVAHGLLQDGSPYSADAIYACWLIFRLCMFPLSEFRRELDLQ